MRGRSRATGERESVIGRVKEMPEPGERDAGGRGGGFSKGREQRQVSFRTRIFSHAHFCAKLKVAKSSTGRDAMSVLEKSEVTEELGPAKFQSMAHVSLPCRDLEEGIAFYVN